MAISIQDLERAFAPVIEVATGELEVELNGTVLVLRSLNPEEENAIQAELFASLHSEDEDEVEGGEGVKASALLDASRIWTLSRAVVQIGGLDLRKQPFVETGETLESGVPVKRARHEVISGILEKWSQPILKRLFRKYLQLTEQVETRAEKELKYEPSDLDAEISRLESRLEALKARKAEIEEGEKTAFEQQLKWVADQDEEERIDTAEDASDLRAGVKARKEEPPEDLPPEPQAAAPQEELGPGQREGFYQPPVAPAREEREAVSDSFVSSGDDDAMAEAVQAETLRQLERRRAMGASVGESPTSGLAAIHAGQQKVAPPMPAPTAHLEPREVLDAPDEKVDQRALQIDAPQAGNINPRFRGGGRR